MKKCLNGFVLLVISIFGHTNKWTYRILDTKDVDMKLLGTSTLDNWEMEARSMTGEAQFVVKPDNKSELVSLKNLSFALEVKDLNNETNAPDNNTYKALKSDGFKYIYHKLVSSAVAHKYKNEHLLKTMGLLTIASVSDEIEMDFRYVANANGTITCF